MSDHPSSTLRRARRSVTITFGLQGFLLVTLLTELPQFKDRYDLSEGVLAGLVFVISLLSALGSVVAERVAIATSSRVAVMVAIATIATAGALISLPAPVGLLAAFLGLYGIGVGMIDAGVNMQGVTVQHGYGRLIIASVYAAWSVGAIVGAVYVSVAESAGLGLTPSVLIAALVVALLGALVSPGLLRTGHEAPIDLSLHGDTVPRAIFLMLGLMMIFLFAIDFGVANWATIYVDEDLAVTSGTAALAVAVYQICGLIARLSADHVVRRVGATPAAAGACLTGVVGMAVAVCAPNAVVAFVGFALVGLGAPAMAPLCFTAVGQIAPPGRLDTLIARLNLFNYAGTIIGGATIGAVAHWTGLRLAFVIPLAFAVGMVAISPVFGRAASVSQPREQSA